MVLKYLASDHSVDLIVPAAAVSHIAPFAYSDLHSTFAIRKRNGNLQEDSHRERVINQPSYVNGKTTRGLLTITKKHKVELSVQSTSADKRK